MLPRFLKINRKTCLNFIVTSKTEIRVFSPLIEFSLKNNLEFFINIFMVNGNHKFDKDLQNLIDRSYNVRYKKINMILLDSLIYKNTVNVICLDHEFFKKQHKFGIEVIKKLKKIGANTVCIQHGGNQADNIKGQISSHSVNQIVFGKIIYDNLLESRRNVKNVFLTGNPLHDRLKSFAILPKFKSDRKIISLITCLHTEYDEYENCDYYYRVYVNNVFTSLDYSKHKLLVKMHPYDNEHRNIYSEIRSCLCISEKDIIIYSSDDHEYSVYNIINKSDLVISRASSIIEEALMINKKVIAYDLFEDGCSKFYDFLLKYDFYKKVILNTSELKAGIITLLEKPINCSKSINEELVSNTTFKLDGKSSERVINALQILAHESE